MKKLLVSLIAATGLMAGTAQAASFLDVVSGTGTVADYSTDGLISFDLDLSHVGTTTLSFAIGAADTAGLSFQALLRNFTGNGITGYSFMLSGGEFAYSGTFTQQFNNLTSSAIDFNGTSASFNFAAPEYLDVEVGNPMLDLGKIDWAINGLSAGDVLTISVTAVPEPETIAMLLAGLAAVAAAARRRQRHDKA